MPTEQPEGNIRDLKDFKDIQRACCKAILLSLVAHKGPADFPYISFVCFVLYSVNEFKSKFLIGRVVGLISQGHIGCSPGPAKGDALGSYLCRPSADNPNTEQQ